MESLDISGLKRRPEVISKYLNVKGDITSVTEDLNVLFPSRYLDRKLALIDTTISVVSIFAILDKDNNYAVVNAPIFVTLTPFSISDVSVDGVEYKSLYFQKDSVMIPNNKSVVRDNFLYDVFDDFFVNGRVPWYLNYNDISNVLLTTKKYANNNIGNDPLGFEILSSIIAREANNKTVYIRHVLDKSNKDKIQPKYIGLNNRFYSYDNTGARLFGSYFGDGLITSIVDPEKKTSATSDILRS